MIARTQIQKEVMQLSKQLPPITERQREWAQKRLFDKVGYHSNGKVWCSHCGHTFEKSTSGLIVDVTGDHATCPHCGTHLHLENSRREKMTERWYFTTLTTRKEWQVCRHFIIEKTLRKGEQPRYAVNEAVQNWISTDGTEIIVARPTAYVPHYYDVWQFDKPMEIRTRRNKDYVPDKYDIDAFVCPGGSVLPILHRNGYTRRIHGLSASSAMKLLLTDREAEILAKNGQHALLAYKHANSMGEFRMPYQHSIKIARRNHYVIKDASMWFDYLGLLDYFHLDTHNAHYVCPADLKAAHDRLLERKRRIEKQKAEERNREEAAKWEKLYQKAKGKYFGICFGNEHIIVTVIQSVADMAEEGKTMHHCVYDMEYFKKKNSLILSARDMDGKRIETVELSIKTFKVIQSRGVCNSATPYHNEIIELVNNNIKLFKAA